jgi:hypothetical protein
MSKRIDLDASVLRDLYCGKGYSLREVSKILNVHKSIIHRNLKRFNIPIRDRNEAYQFAKEKGVLNATRARGAQNPHWKGGRKHCKDGYVDVIYPKDYPFERNHRTYIREHILIWELAHNQKMPKGWNIHHLNGIKDDNRIENLLGLPAKEHGERGMGKHYKKRIVDLEKRIKILEQSLRDNQLIFMG